MASSKWKESNDIQCTFNDCYQRFPSVEAMKKHKAKANSNPEDEVHSFYCKKCDEDCSDDVEYLIHQIQSPKHIVCPACGQEFKSEGGRDRHVGISHREKQSLKCQGCQENFTDAAGLMGHIEGNKCRIIKRDDFHRQLAEQQIERDAMEELQGGMVFGTTTTSQSGSDGFGGGVSLLDDRRVLERDWDGAPVESQQATSYSHPDTTSNNMSQAMSDLVIEKFPPLAASKGSTNVAGTTRTRYEIEHDPETNTALNGTRESVTVTRTSSDLLDLTKEPEVQQGRSAATSTAWGNRPAARLQRSHAPEPSVNLLDNASSINLLDASVVDRETVATRGTRPSQADYHSGFIPPAARAENLDPNAPNAQVQTKIRLPSRANLARYYDPLAAVYVCPGARCNQRARSIEAFEHHLTSGAHVGGMVQCPCCLKRFKTTTALVAHAESGSTRCDLRKTEAFDLAIQQITAGMVRVEGSWSGAGNAKFKSVPIDQW